MPSHAHEAPLLLLREHPELLPRLLRDALRLALPAYRDLEILDPDFTQLVPTERRADLVMCLRAEAAVLGVIVELQLARDEDKRYSWPLYTAALHAKLACPTCLVVVTTDAGVARWAARPITTLQPGSPFAPLVIGPDRIPRITSAEAARAAPELAVLSALAHGNQPDGMEVLLPVIEALAAVDERRATLYFDLILGALNPVARHALETKMQTRYEYQSEFARRYFSQGREEGRAQGELTAVRAVLSRLVQSRLGRLSEGIASRIEACTRVDQLTEWVVAVGNAAGAADVEAVFAGPRP